ncbi:MAG: HPr family phosphocarrier protein [Candidatus Aenigmarchaeota archaeon]|nr:HPr family phosphocarrier protein [Candidatus Aenigmarchaeota archaeon]
MLRKKVKVKVENGLHLRVANRFVQITNQHPGEVTVIKGDAVANGKSILSLVILCAQKGDTLILEIHGKNEQEEKALLDELVAVLHGKIS